MSHVCRTTQISHGILADRYTWDHVGNLLTVTDQRSPQLSTSRARGFLYDDANRLIYAEYQAPGLGPYSYVYDIHDNIELATRPDGNRHYEYDSTTRRLTRLRNSSFQTQIAYLYDEQGNAKLRDATGLGLDAYAYHYDRANRLIEVRDPLDETKVQASYLYDANARRVLIEEDGEQRVQVYSQAGQYLFEEPDLISDASFTTGESEPVKPRTRYQYLGNMLIARSSGSQTTYLHTDHLGSPIAESTAGPTVEVTHLPLHEPYGAPSNGTYLDGPGYTGHVVDGLTGLSYMQARYYDPVAGRFLGVDPVHVDLGSGGNFGRYVYANNNPYGFVDPDGRVGVVAVLAAAAVGCAASQACTGIVLGTALILTSQGLGDPTTTSPDMSGGFYGEMINESAEITTDGSAEPSGRSNDDKLDDLIAGGKVEGESSTKKIGREGDEAVRDKEFDDIGLNDVKDKGKVKVGATDSGRRVVARPSTEDGRPTIEVQRPDGKPTVKIRYGSSTN